MSLALEEVIIESHDDYEIWASVTVGFDAGKNFVIRLQSTDYDHHENDYTEDLVVSFEDAFRMSRRLHINMVDLPSHMASRFGDYSNLSVPSAVSALFKTMAGYVLDCGAHYKIVDRRRR